MNSQLPAAISDLAEPETFRAFYREAIPKVYSYFYFRCGGSRATAEDLTQITFLAAVREIQRGRAVTRPVPWILGIASHKLVDHYRRLEREERRLRLVWSAPDVAPDLGPESIVDRELIVEVLAQLPPAQRGALVLRYLDGLSVVEVAASLGRSEHAAESLLSRARSNFRYRYSEACDER